MVKHDEEKSFIGSIPRRQLMKMSPEFAWHGEIAASSSNIFKTYLKKKQLIYIFKK